MTGKASLPSRRDAMGMAGVASLLATMPAADATPGARPRARPREQFLRGTDPSLTGLPPAQAAATEGYFAVPGGRLWYWDTGGKGQIVVLMHPMTGSALSWPYQQPFLARAGYRVLAFSRRGAYRSESEPGHDEQAPGDDLAIFADALKLDRFHLVGAAAGGFAAVRYALAHQSRLHSLVVAGSLLGLSEPAHLARARSIAPPGFMSLPAEFRELSPSYRAANPKGVSRWLEIEGEARSRVEDGGASRARAAPPPPPGTSSPGPSYADLRTLHLPIHLIFGDADLYSPPSLARPLLEVLPQARLTTIGEAGHATFWEQPEAFNAALLPFG